MDDVLILTGFMGVGKSATGRTLAALVGWDFLDLDLEVEAAAGRSIPELFSEHGEDHFRALESEALGRALERRRTVIATGGGILLREANRRLLEGRRVLYLHASPTEILRRLRGSSTRRPLLDSADPEERVRSLYAEREELYASVGQRVDTEGRTTEEVARDIARLFLGREAA